MKGCLVGNPFSKHLFLRDTSRETWNEMSIDQTSTNGLRRRRMARLENPKEEFKLSKERVEDDTKRFVLCMQVTIKKKKRKTILIILKARQKKNSGK